MIWRNNPVHNILVFTPILWFKQMFMFVFSFAESCFFLNDGNFVHCDCKEGYIGERCERCAAGYYGQPEVLGKCKERKACFVAQKL